MGHKEGPGICRMRIMMTEAFLVVSTVESNREGQHFHDQVSATLSS